MNEFEARNPKITKNSKEMDLADKRMVALISYFEFVSRFMLRISNSFIVSDFGFRISDGV